jgi:SSS family transporter
MSLTIVLICVIGYFLSLLAIGWWTSRNAGASAYYLGNKASPWYIVAFGFISDSLSGVTFISVPGTVGAEGFAYMQVVFGYLIGYAVIALVLLPLYYRLNLTSIYTFLGMRFGPATQRTGASFFLASRLIGAAARLYLAVNVFQVFVLDRLGVPFAASIAVVIGMMLLYTYKGGIRTLVWTDAFQTFFLLSAVLGCAAILLAQLGDSTGEALRGVGEKVRATLVVSDWQSPRFFWKQFIGGIFLAIVMTGLDQNMMQKNLSCRTLRDAQKNILSYSVASLLVNFAFLALGALLFVYAQAQQLTLPARTDELFPTLALQHFGTLGAVLFTLGLTAATFSSADSVLTTLTTSFRLDVLRQSEEGGVSRHRVHVGFAVALFATILVFKALNSGAVVNTVLKIAGYTYGPILGLFAFGMFRKATVRDPLVPLVCLATPLICLAVEQNAARWLGGYKIGFEILVLNGLLTFAGLSLLVRRAAPQSSTP